MVSTRPGPASASGSTARSRTAPSARPHSERWCRRSRRSRSPTVAAIRRVAPDGVQRIVEVSLSDNADLDAAVAAPEAVIAAYATRDPRPEIDFWPMLFANLTIRLLGSDDF